MNIIERYQDLVLATISRARHLGMQARMESAPHSTAEPFVFTYKDILEKRQPGRILLFPPGNVCLNSTALSELIALLKTAESQHELAIVLFSEDDLRGVHNVLIAAGISRHAAVYGYVKNSNSHPTYPRAPRYTMDWLLPEPVSSPAADDQLAAPAVHRADCRT